MAYKPKIVTGKVTGTGWPIDGHVLYFSQWDYDKGELWHLYGWDDAADEVVKLTMYEWERAFDAEETPEDLDKRQKAWEDFNKAWKAGTWKPSDEFCLLPDNVEVQEVKQEENRNAARDKLIAHGFDLSPRRSDDTGGVLCLPLDKNLNGDVQAKHPDWEAVSCPNCGRKCWKAPGVDKMVKDQGVQLLCTACALEAGLVRPYRPNNNTPKPGGNREQRRRAKHEQRRKNKK